jgi:hypothetical protein
MCNPIVLVNPDHQVAAVSVSEGGNVFQSLSPISIASAI